MATLNTQRTTLIDTIIFKLAHRHGKFFRRQSKIRASSSSAFCMSLPHNTTIGTVQSVDFVHSDCKMATSLLHMLKIKQDH